jgi:phage shock protein A
MFDALRQAFQEAVQNFRTELNRDQVPEAADALIRSMERELVEARVILDRLGKELEETRKEAAREEEELRACLRREELARRIGDAETEEVARSFAARHLQRKDVLDDKIRVLERELADRRTEVEEMTGQLKGARTRREAMTAQAGRSGARGSLQEADALFDELDRMAERVGETGARAEAARELDELEGLGPRDHTRPPPPPSEDELEARLRILKERMGQE